MESLIIGIAGGSGSGKSTFTNRIKKRFGDDVVVLYHDNYYRRQDGIPFEQRVTVNYDHPDSLEGYSVICRRITGFIRIFQCMTT